LDINRKIIKGIQDSLAMELEALGDISLENLDELEVWVKEKSKSYLKMLVPPKFHDEYNESFIVSEVIVNASKFTPETKMMSDPKDHVPWLNSERKSNRNYWDSYENSLQDFLEEDSVTQIDEVTDKILEQLEDPTREGPWDRRGLVVGHVQSGKTSNYTGIIAKAADAGYKIIIVLAGMHNNLRSQTQLRLESGFLGYETDADGRTDKIIGVGNYRDKACKPNAGTNRSERGDFSKAKAKNISTISPEEQPWIFVIKKNKSILEALIKWIGDAVCDSKDSETGRKVVTKLPLIVIDDEADNASVDTNQQFLMDGLEPDPEHDPTTINKLIRRILHFFSRKAYIGYTATPFANVFIHHKGETITEGRDLFPSSFIVNLETPNNYVGPSQVFDDIKSKLFIRHVTDNVDFKGNEKDGWMPNKHRTTHTPLYMNQDTLPPSLKEALHSFLLSSCVRYLRGDSKAHWSMLVHVTRFNFVQEHVAEQIKGYLKNITQRITRGIAKQELLAELKKLWLLDFVPTTAKILPTSDIETRNKIKRLYFIEDLPDWELVTETLLSVISDFKVLTINGRAKEALEYEEYKSLGLKVIAVGGDKLSRGLTLEGLSTSYFLRASRMYDTLMQMGRWFGYRTRYYDLCRLYTSEDLVDWFSKIALANEELREEFNLMSSLRMSPHEFGLKVQSHPGLLITSPLKMTNSETLHLSFSGNTIETVAFVTLDKVVESNFLATLNFLKNIDSYKQDKSIYGYNLDTFKGLVYQRVQSSKVIEYLKGYRTHSDACKANTDLLANFINQMNTVDELLEWTVAVVSGDSSSRKVEILNQELFVTKRKPNLLTESKASIGRLLDPKHELIDVTKEQYADALLKTIDDFKAGKTKHKTEPDRPSNKTVRFIKGYGGPSSKDSRRNGLLLVYPLDIAYEEDADLEGYPQIGLGLIFPDSNSGVKVPYAVNSVFEAGGQYEY
jgi:hypothetical protein